MHNLEHMITAILSAVHNGTIHESTALTLLGCSHIELNEMMTALYGRDWQATARLNYSIDRYGEDLADFAS